MFLFFDKKKILTNTLISTLFSTSNDDIQKSIKGRLYKSFLVYFTKPFTYGSKICIDRYCGRVQSINLMYIELKDYKKTIYIPTSFVYDKVIIKYD